MAVFVFVYMHWKVQCGLRFSYTCIYVYTYQHTVYAILVYMCTCTHVSTHCNTLQHTETHCNTLKRTATHCSTLQHTRFSYTCTHLSHVFCMYVALFWFFEGCERQLAPALCTHIYIFYVCIELSFFLRAAKDSSHPRFTWVYVQGLSFVYMRIFFVSMYTLIYIFYVCIEVSFSTYVCTRKCRC